MSNQIIDQQINGLEEEIANIANIVEGPSDRHSTYALALAGSVVAGQRLDAGVPFKKDDAEVLVGLAAILSFFVS
jgi:hypothetical protein